MPQSYTFHGFTIKPEELSIYHHDKRLELGLKGFRILEALIKNQGKLVPKDELISNAWGKQIVTDGTLSKQVERIRQVFRSINPEYDFIETTRGIGYKFTSVAKVIKHRKNGLAKWQKTIASVSILPLVIFLYFYPFSNSLKKDSAEGLPFNIAVIPAAQGDNYMNMGGIEYLSKLLGRNPRIYYTSPKSSWFHNKNKKQLAIELEDQKNLDFVLLVNIDEDKESKFASVEIKNSQQFNKKQTLKSRSFKQLFADINSWVLTQLQLEYDSNEYKKYDNLSSDGFATESYLRGKKESTSGNYSQAISYYNTAIFQDPNFDLAKLDLARTQILSSDYAAAEALLKTLESTKQLNDYLKLYLLSIKASLYTNTLRSSEVKTFIDETITLAQKVGDTKALIMAMFFQGQMYLHNGNIELCIQNTLKQKEIIEANSKDKTDLMRIANNLANLYSRTNQYEKAKQQVKKSIKYYEQMNNTVGRLAAYNNLAAIEYDLAQYNLALKNNNKAMLIIDKVQDQYLIKNTLEISAYLQIELGLHQQCRETIRTIEDLSIKMGVKNPQHIAQFITTGLNQRLGNKSLLKEDIVNLKIISQLQSDDSILSKQMALINLIQIYLEFDEFEKAKKELAELKTLVKNDHSQSTLFYQLSNYQLMYKTNNNKQEALTKIKEILSNLINTKQNRNALMVAYILLDFDQQQDYSNSLSLLNQIKHILPFPYPYLKYKAKLEAHNKNYFEAIKLMQQLKNTSNEWWNTQDQLLLDDYNELNKSLMQ